MKEINFIRNNIEKWQRIEDAVEDVNCLTPDEIADYYVEVTADLAFAYTNYPSSRITQYLNGLASALHNSIYGNKRDKRSRFATFWTREVPLTMYAERRLLLLSFAIFALSMAVGIVSQLADPSFCRSILGDQYVDMTIENIAQGKPMDVYASDDEMPMFLSITFNNIVVAFRTFVLGIFTCFGTAYSLFFNGIMLGCFEAFFAQHGLFGQSFLAVFLHGTLEISAIIVAGAAGIALGNGLLFPGTYPRLVALRMGAKRGLKIVVGTVPLFVVAGFIEGFVTRHTELPDELRLLVIGLSAAFVTFYFIILPYALNKKQNIHGKNTTPENRALQSTDI